MTDDDHFRLHFGPYTTPPFRYGEIVHCEVRGDVKIVGLADGKIPWPIGKRGRASTYVVCRRSTASMPSSVTTIAER